MYIQNFFIYNVISNLFMLLNLDSQQTISYTFEFMVCGKHQAPSHLLLPYISGVYWFPWAKLT